MLHHFEKSSWNCVSGEITVFLSLLLVILLSLLSVMLESVRVEIGKTRAESLVDLGLYSTFGEYRKELLEEYDLWGINKGMGSLKQEIDELQYSIGNYIGIDPLNTTDLTKLSLEGIQLSEYELLTDHRGHPFKKQVIDMMRVTFRADILESFLEDHQINKVREVQEFQKEQLEDTDKQLEELEELGKSEVENEELEREEVEQEAEVDNPLDTLKEIKKKGILELVCAKPEELSSKKVELSSLPSNRKLHVGNRNLKSSKEEEEGLLEEIAFQEYLLLNFSNIRKPMKEGALSYEVEYLLGGKESDIENLKSVVHRLLFIREGCNFAYLLSDPKKVSQAYELSVLIFGATGLPPLIEVGKMAILLGWAYGESLLDVRSLLNGEKVPLFKDAYQWRLELSKLGEVLQELEETSRKEEEGKGMGYEEYLKLLLILGDKNQYPMRGLDLIEGNIQKGQTTFKIDESIVWCEIRGDWRINSMFTNLNDLSKNEFGGISYTRYYSYGYER